MKHNLKQLGLILLLAALIFGLFVGAALAEDGEGQEGNDLFITLSTDALKKGNDLIVTFNAQEGYNYSLSVEKKNAGEGDEPFLTIDTEPNTDGNGSYFSVSWDALKNANAEGQLCTVTVKGTNEAEDDEQNASASFMVMNDSQYNVGLVIHGLDEDNGVPVGRDIAIYISADSAKSVKVMFGEGEEQDVTDLNWQRGFGWSWDSVDDFVFYVRAEFEPPLSEAVWVVSEPIFIHTYVYENAELPAPVLAVDENTGTEVERGKLIEVKVTNAGLVELPVEAEDLLLNLYIENSDNDWLWKDVYAPSTETVQVPTVTLPAGEYQVRAYWSAIGYDHEVSKAITISVPEETTPEAVLGITPEEIEPHGSYMVYGYLPDAVAEKLPGYDKNNKAVCLFCDDGVIYEQWDGDSFTVYDGGDRQGAFTYTLGYWNAELETWAKTQYTATATITEGKAPEALGDLGLSAALGDEELNSGAAIGREDSMTVTLSPLDAEGLKDAEIIPDEVGYDLYLWDEENGEELLHDYKDLGDFNEDGVLVYTLPGEDEDRRFEPQPGHAYVLSYQAHVYGYETIEREFRFAVVTKVANDMRMQLSFKDDEDEREDNTVTVNEAFNVTITVPEYFGTVQFFHDNHWEDINKDEWESLIEEGNTEENPYHYYHRFSRNWDIGWVGRQVLMARATWNSADDEEIDWEDVESVSYSAPVTLTVTGNGAATLPAFSLDNNSLTRGETLNVALKPTPEEVTAIEESVRHFNVEIERDFGEDVWQGVYDQDFEPDGEDWTIPVSTMGLEESNYRLVLHAVGKPGYESTESWRKDPDARFAVSVGEDAAIAVTGEYVEPVEDDGDKYNVWVNTDFRVIGFVDDAERIALFEGDELVDEWDGDSFDWNGWSGETDERTFDIRVWGEDDWREEAVLSVTVIGVTKENYEELEIKNLSVSSTYGEAGIANNAIVKDGDEVRAYTIEFDDDVNAEFYNAEVRVRGWDEPARQWDDIRKDGDSDSYYYSGTRFTLTDYNSWYRVGDVVEIVVRAYAPGVPCAEETVVVPVINAPDDTIKLEVVSPNQNEGKFLVNQNFTVKITTDKEDNLTAAQLYIDGEWRTHELEKDGDAWIFEESTGAVGTQELYVRVTVDEVNFEDDGFDWDAVEWSNVSEYVSVDFGRIGRAQLPEISLVFDEANENREVTAGAPLTIVFDEIDEEYTKGLDGYHIRILNAEDPDDWEDRDQLDIQVQSGNFYYGTGNLQPGNYCVLVEAMTQGGYEGDSTERDNESLYFTVIEAKEISLVVYGPDGEPAEDGVLNVDTCDTYVLSGAAPGYSAVLIRDERSDREWISEDRSTVSGTDSWENSGKHVYVLLAYDEEQDDWVYVTKGDGEEAKPYTVTVNVEAKSGALNQPAITVEGDNVSVKFDKNAEFRYVRVYHDDNWEDAVMEPDPEVNENGLWEGSLSDLSVGERYSVYAWNGAPGYEASEERLDFVHTPAEQDGDYSIELSLYDFDEDQEVLLTSDRLLDLTSNRIYGVNIKMTHEGDGEPVKPARLQLYWEGGWSDEEAFWPSREGDSYFNDGGYTFGYSCGTSYTFNAVVRAAWNVEEDTPDEEVENWVYSNTLSLRFPGAEKIALPKYEIDIEDSKLTVTLSDFSEIREQLTEAEAIDDDYYRQIKLSIVRRFDEREMHWQQVDIPATVDEGEDDTVTVVIDLSKIDPDGDDEPIPLWPGDYRVHLHKSAPEGMEDNWTEGDDESMWFTVPARLTIQKWNEANNEWADAEVGDDGYVSVETLEEYRIVGDVPEGIRVTLNSVEDWAVKKGFIECTDFHSAEGEDTYSLFLYDEEDGSWYPLEGGPEVKVRVKANGDLAEPELTIPETVSVDDEELSFSFTVPEETELTEAWISCLREDGKNGRMINLALEQDDDGNFINVPEPASIKLKDGVYTVTVPTKVINVEQGSYTGDDALLEGSNVSFGVVVAARGYNYAVTESYAPVVGDSAEGILLSIDGVDGTDPDNAVVNAQSRQALSYHVAISPRNVAGEGEEENNQYPTRAQIYLDNGWHNINGDDVLEYRYPVGEEFADLDFELDWLESGEHAIQVRATWDEDDNDAEPKWYYGNIVKVSVTGESIEAPVVTLTLKDDETLPANRRVQRGQQLELHFAGNLTHIHEYHVRVYTDAEWEDEAYFMAADAAETVTLSTASLPEGNDYWIGVWYNTDVGYDSLDSWGSDLSFRVVKGGNTFTLSAAEVQTKQRFRVDAFIPDAELRVVPLAAEDDEGEYRYSEGDILSEEFEYDQEGTYEFRLEQRIDDEWVKVDEDEDSGFKNPISIKVTAPNGAIEEPDIILPAVVLRDEDGYTNLTDGEFTVEVNGVEKDDIYINVELLPEEGECIYGWYDTTERAFTLPADIEPGRYRINVYTWQVGYNSSGTEKQFDIMQAPEEGAPTLTLSINGETEAVEVRANEDYTLSYQIDDLDEERYEVKNLQILWDEEWRDCLNPEDDEFLFVDGRYTRCDNSDERELMLRAVIEDNEGEAFTVVSNPVSLTVNSDGTVPAPEVTLSGFEEAEEGGEQIIRKGNAVTVEVTIPQDKDFHDKVTFVDLNLKQAGDNGEYWDHVRGVQLYKGAPTETITATLPVDDLEVGRRYRVEIFVGAEAGYDSYATDYENKSLYFTVAERENADEPALTVPDEVTAGMDTLISGYLPKAERINLFVEKTFSKEEDREKLINEEGWEGDSFTDTYFFDEKGAYTLTLAYWFNGQWMKVDANVEGASKTVTAAYIGNLAAPKVTAGNAFQKQNYTFTVGAVDNANSGYHVMVWHDQDTIFDEWYNPSDVKDGVITVTIPWDEKTLGKYALDSQFTVYADAQGVGYALGSSNDVSFYLRADPEFSVKDSKVNTNFEFEVNASVPDAEVLKLMRGDKEIGTIDNYRGSFKVTEIEPGVYTYTLVALNGDEEINHRFNPIEIIVTHEGSVEDLKTLNTISLPDDLTKIDEQAFSGIAAQAVVIPDNVTTIGSKAFQNCKSLQYVSIPKGATVAEDAFAGCTSLVEIVRRDD